MWYRMTLMILGLLSCPSPAMENSTIRTLTFEVSVKPESELSRTLTKAFQEILHKLDYDFKTISLPPKRGLQELKAGRVDGSIGRIGNLVNLLQAEDLLRLDTPVAVFPISRWCRKDLDKNAATIRLGTRLGTLVLMMLQNHIDMKRVKLEEVNDQKGVVQMLKSARLDCLLSGELLMEADGVNMQELQRFDRFDLISFEVFPWILRRHEQLKPRLDSGLRSYPFSKAFRKKFLEQRPACEGKLNVLCPDGLIIKYRADFG